MKPSNDFPKKDTKKNMFVGAFVLLTLVVLLKQDSGDSARKPSPDKKALRIETNVDVDDVKSNVKEQKKRRSSRANKWRRNRVIALFGMAYDELVDSSRDKSLAQIDEQGRWGLDDELSVVQEKNPIA